MLTDKSLLRLPSLFPFIRYTVWLRQNRDQTFSLEKEPHREREQLPWLAALRIYCQAPEVKLQKRRVGQESVFYHGCFSVGLLPGLMILLQMIFAEFRGCRQVKWMVGSLQPCEGQHRALWLCSVTGLNWVYLFLFCFCVFNYALKRSQAWKLLNTSMTYHWEQSGSKPHAS